MAKADSQGLCCFKILILGVPYFCLLNISTISHVTSCRDTWKSVDSWLKREHWQSQCWVQPRPDAFDSAHHWAALWRCLAKSQSSDNVFELLVVILPLNFCMVLPCSKLWARNPSLLGSEGYRKLWLSWCLGGNFSPPGEISWGERNGGLYWCWTPQHLYHDFFLLFTRS